MGRQIGRETVHWVRMGRQVDGSTGRRVDRWPGRRFMSKEGEDEYYLKIVIVFGFVDRLTGRQVDRSTG